MGCPLRFVLLLFFFPFLFLSDPKPLRARTRTRGLSSSEPNRWDFIFRAVRIRLLKGPENGDGAPTEPHSGHGRTGEGGGDFSGGPEPLRSLCLLALPSIHSSFHPSVSPSVRPSIYPSIHPRGCAQHPTEPHARSPLPTAGTTPALVPPSFPRGLPAAPAPLGRSRRGGTTPPQRNPRIGGRCAAPLAAKGPGAVPGPGGRLPRTPRT